MLPRLLNNFWLKVTAVALGLLIWMHVATDKQYSYRLRLPLTTVVLADSLTLASNPPESLRVSVGGTGKQLLRKMWRSRGLRLSASGFGPGRHQVTLSTNNTSLVGAVGDITLEDVLGPTQVSLIIDRLTEVEVPVQRAWTATADDGFAIREPVAIEPALVRMSGPRRQLSAIPYIETEDRQLDGLRNDVSVYLKLVPPPLFGLTVEPDSVKVTFNVVAVKTRVFDALEVRIFNTPPDSFVLATPELVRVELTGPPGAIDDLDAAAVMAAADFRSRSSSGFAPLSIDCPPAFKLKSVSVDSVQLTVENNADTGN